MVILNLVFSVLSVLGAFLVARAYFPHIPLRDRTPTAWLARAFVVASASYFIRTIYRDIYHTLLGTPPDHAGFYAALNLGLLISEYCALRARLESIPAHERREWNVLTAPWYPGGPTIRRRRRDQ